jgi:hypothetical protein
MALAQDPIAALIDYLQANGTISSLLSTRVYGLKLPEADAASMPRQCIVINGAGGIGEASFIETFKMRLDFFCYGETSFEAWETYLTLHTVLKQMDRNVINSTLLLSAIHSAGPFPATDQKTEWPVVVDTWVLEFHTTLCV